MVSRRGTKSGFGSRLLRLLALAAAWPAVFFVSAEVLFRITSLDTIMMRPLLRHMPLHPRSYVQSENTELLYELKSGSREVYGRDVVEINSFGLRDKPRRAEKDGAFRIMAVGASTIYGHDVNHEETFPYYLEELLRKRLGRPVEVWNAGFAGMVLRQQVEVAKRLLAYGPDAYLIMVTNSGTRSMLVDEDYTRLFRKNFDLWYENLRYLPRQDLPLARWLFRHSYFFRVFAVAANYLLTMPRNNPMFMDEAPNLAALQAFVRENGGDIPMFLIPSLKREEEVSAIEGARVIRLFDMAPKGAGPEYFVLHPPAHVFRWYAETIARELAAAGLFSRESGGRR